VAASSPALRRVAFVASLVVLVIWAFFGLGGGSNLVPTGTRVGALRAELDDGSVYALGADPGQVLVLNFWATWCGPCRQEAPILSSVRQGDVQVIGVVIEDMPLSKASAKAREIGVRYPVALDRGGLMRRFKVQAVPTTYVLSPDGTVVFGQTGVVTRGELQAAIAKARPAG